jgi:D-arabinan exo alpha-(1,3)/(1,5)-arabinofuranosidase (non-reducing end)
MVNSNDNTIPYGLMGLLQRRAGRVRLASSNDRDPERGAQFGGLRTASARRKRILLEPGEEHSMATLNGSGVITRLWMTALPLNARVLRGLSLKFYWDGEAEPSVEAPLGDFFGAPFGRYIAYSSLPLGLTGGGLISFWPMPFSRGAHLAVVNQGDRRIDPFYYQVTYLELGHLPETGLRFHALWHRENPTRVGQPYRILETQGSGHYVGCHLFLQSREWWLRPPWRWMVFPRGFGLGMLEGRSRVYVDGEGEASVRGTGTEDDFGGGLYYLPGGRFSGLTHGCTVRDYLRSRFAVYRFDIDSPIPFERSLRVEIDHGVQNELAADYTSVAYWYQDEPHRTTGSAKSPGKGPPASALQLTQIALAVAIPLAVMLGIFAGMRMLKDALHRYLRREK